MKLAPPLLDLLWHLDCRGFAAVGFRRARRAARQGAPFHVVRALLKRAEANKSLAANAFQTWHRHNLTA